MNISPKAYFKTIGDTIKLVFFSGKNKNMSIDFDGDTLQVKANETAVVSANGAGWTIHGALASTSVSASTIAGTTIIGDLTGDVTGDVLGDIVGIHTGDVITDSISEETLDAGVEIEQVVLKNKGIWLSDNAAQYVKEVLIPTGQITGVLEGALGHANGFVLVESLGAGYVIEFVSALLIYDFATAAYTGGGGDDLVIRVGATAVSPVVASADLLNAAGDQIVHLRALSAADYDLPDGSDLNLKSTEVTNPGLPEEFTIEVTAAEDTGGSVEVTLDGTVHNIPITADTAEVNAGEIQVYIHNLQGYTATVLAATVTVTASTNGAQTDATFGQGTANSSAATVTVTQQGVDQADGVIRAHVTYKVHSTGL